MQMEGNKSNINLVKIVSDLPWAGVYIGINITQNKIQEFLTRNLTIHLGKVDKTSFNYLK